MASNDYGEQEQIWINKQSELKKKLIVGDEVGWDPKSIRLIGGVDVSFPKNDTVHACPCLVVLSYSEDGKHIEIEYEDSSLEHLNVPYIPNFLAFREAPLLKEKIDKLRKERPELMPQVIMVDGNGVHHKRGFGIASHLGVLIDLPTIGVAKNLLHIDGSTDKELHKKQVKSKLKKRGDKFPLKNQSGDATAMALRTSTPHGAEDCKPIYVSVGHKIGLKTAEDLVLKWCKYKIPEPTRQADIVSRKFLRENYEQELARCPCSENFPS